MVDWRVSDADMLRPMTRKKTSVAGSPDVAQIVAKMRSDPAKGRGQRSPLYLWFRHNRARLLEEFATKAPSWPGLAAALGENGILNGEGKRPTAEGARTVWYRVRREMSGGARVAPSRQSPPAIRPVEDTQTAQPLTGNGEAEAPRRFGTVRLRGPAPGAPDTAGDVDTPPTAPNVDVDEVLSRFMPGALKR